MRVFFNQACSTYLIIDESKTEGRLALLITILHRRIPTLWRGAGGRIFQGAIHTLLGSRCTWQTSGLEETAIEIAGRPPRF